MEVAGIGGSAGHTDALAKVAALPRVPETALSPGVTAAGPDSVASLLEQLASPQVSNLIQEIEKSRQALNVVPAGELFTRAVAATRAGDVPQALAALTDLVHAHPGRADTLPLEPALAPIRPQVENLVHRLTDTVRADAEQKIDAAVKLVHSGAHRAETNPQSVIAVAERLLASGQYPNIVLSADLAQAAISYYGPFPVTAAGVGLPGNGIPKSVALQVTAGRTLGSLGRMSERLAARAGSMWRSAPLLLMLIVWMTAGLLMGMVSVLLRELSVTSPVVDGFFYIWALGFLGLVGFGFYRSLRRLLLQARMHEYRTRKRSRRRE